MRGIVTSTVEVTDISEEGFALRLDCEQLQVSFDQFPWFRSATAEQLTNLQRPTANHLYWPLLDLDVSVESVRDPAAFPLVSKAVP